jgi:hypothetical protein
MLPLKNTPDDLKVGTEQAPHEGSVSAMRSSPGAAVELEVAEILTVAETLPAVAADA